MTKYLDFTTGNSLLDESLENYLMYGFEPGGFLTSVLANDLWLSIGRADHWNKQKLPEIVNEIVFKMPSISIGSYDAVKDWCRDKDGRRTEYAACKEKEYLVKVLKGNVYEKVQAPPF